jgi:hypothetical protein
MRRVSGGDGIGLTNGAILIEAAAHVSTGRRAFCEVLSR